MDACTSLVCLIWVTVAFFIFRALICWIGSDKESNFDTVFEQFLFLIACCSRTSTIRVIITLLLRSPPPHAAAAADADPYKINQHF